MPSTELLERPVALAAAAEVVPVGLSLRDLMPFADGDDFGDAGASAAPRPRRGIDRLFVCSVVLPVAAAAVALFGLAGDRYTSEARFLVRASSETRSAADAMPGLAGHSLARAGEDAYVVDAFVRSRDAFAEILADPALTGALDRPDADLFGRFPAVLSSPTREELFDRFRAMVRTDVDAGTGISTVAVTAFRPDDARALARALTRSAEGMVNRINGRAQSDGVAFATGVLAESRAAVTDVERRLTEFRNASGTVDPLREYSAALANVGRLTVDASQREATLDQQMALTPNAPGIASQREKVRSLRDEIDRANLAIAGGQGSLAGKLESYERLSVERDMAVKSLAGAEFAFEASRRDAQRQHLYLQTIAAPNLPDTPSGPRRILLLLAVAAGGLTGYLGLRQLKSLAEDHVA